MLKKRLIASAIAAALSLGIAQAEETSVLKDAQRIVSVGGSVTEIVYALGQEKRLIGRDSTSNFPPAVEALPDVGYMRQLSPEGVLSVNPDGIVALHGSGPKEAVDVLKKASVPYVDIPETFDRAGIVAKVRAVGKALGQDAEAATLAKSIDAKLVAAEEATANVTERKRVLFILSLQGGRVLASGTGTAADGIIRMAGGVNAVAGYDGYKQLTDEAAVTAKPDVILMMDRGGGPSVSADEVFAVPALATTPAAANRSLVKMDGEYLLGFGPRTAEAVHELAVALYGDQVGH